MKWKKPPKLTVTERFKKSVLELDETTQKKLKRKLHYLMSDPRHPSLQIKKIKGTRSIFEARVNSFYRFTFEFGKDKSGKDNEIKLRVIGPYNSALKKS